MSIETDLRAAIINLAPNRVFPDFAPPAILAETAPAPFITYQVVGGRGRQTIQKADSLKIYRVQVNCYGKTRILCSNLAILVESALHTASAFKAVALNEPISTYEDEVGLYGCIQDFSIHYNIGS
mgnify:CR=1 FL=1|jgi:hypothetical protein